MRKLLPAVVVLLLVITSHAQNSEELVPSQAVSVFSVNNINLLQKISLDDLVKYEFMEEVQQELFDGSTRGKTLKESGIDFDQKLNVFTGRSQNFQVSGLTFGVKNIDQLFDVFDDYSPIDSDYKDISFYESFFNRIAIRGNSGILFRIDPDMEMVDRITDSIWYARGNDYPWYDDQFEELYYQLEELQEEDEFGISNEMETEENTNVPEINEYPLADDDPNTKTYYELRDSVELALHGEFLKDFCDELFIEQNNLIKNSPQFKAQLEHNSEGVFYSDNSRNFSQNKETWYLRSLYPGLFTDIEELYSSSVLLGDLMIGDDGIDLNLRSTYNEQLGSIYKELTDTKFDKNVLKYVDESNSAFFSYNIDLEEAYEQMYDIITPIMEKSEDPMIVSNLMVLDILNEFLDKEALFDTYQGSMFGTYSGIQKIKTKKVVFDYDEETFEYSERIEEAEEDMPIFTLGFTTENNEFSNKILKRVSRLNPNVQNKVEYWEVENGILNSAPLFFILKNGLFIITNNEDLARKSPDGYSKNALSKQLGKKAKKNGVAYAYMDLGKAIESLPRGLFNDRENEMLDVVRGKNGIFELTSSKTTETETEFHFKYKFDGPIDNSGTYILDLINSLYVVTK